MKSIFQNSLGVVPWLHWPRASMFFFAFVYAWAHVRQWFEMPWSFPGGQTWGEMSSEIYLGDNCMAWCKAISQCWPSTFFAMHILPSGRIYHLLWLSWAPKSDCDLVSSGWYSGTSPSRPIRAQGRQIDSSRTVWGLDSPRVTFLATWSAWLLSRGRGLLSFWCSGHNE